MGWLMCVGQGASAIRLVLFHTQVGHSAGLHAELSTCWDFDMETAPIYAGCLDPGRENCYSS